MATDYHLKLDTVEGESQKEGHAKEIEVISWSWGGSNDGSFAVGSGGGTGRFSAHDINLNVPLSKASGKLLQACTKGSHIDSITLNFSKVTYEYFAQDASKGTVTSTGSISYDLAKAVAA